jgi:Uma2 family endonuclease
MSKAMLAVSLEHRHLLTVDELPDSDETPVDNELQNDIPNILLNLLREIWTGRTDWFWGVDMAVYYDPNPENPADYKTVVPDGFLALGVPRYYDEGCRLSYAIWVEKVLPILVLEVISKKYNGEYEGKLELYQKLGIRYYVIYNPLSGRRGAYKERLSLEVYELINGEYKLMPSIPTDTVPAALLPEGGKMVWLEDVGLGIGCVRNELNDLEREWLYWYDRSGLRYPTSKERTARAEAIALQERLAKQIAEQAQQQAEAIAAQERLKKQQAEAIALQERQQKEKLAAYLRSLGINPDEI